MKDKPDNRLNEGPFGDKMRNIGQSMKKGSDAFGSTSAGVGVGNIAAHVGNSILAPLSARHDGRVDNLTVARRVKQDWNRYVGRSADGNYPATMANVTAFLKNQYGYSDNDNQQQQQQSGDQGGAPTDATGNGPAPTPAPRPPGPVPAPQPASGAANGSENGGEQQSDNYGEVSFTPEEKASNAEVEAAFAPGSTATNADCMKLMKKRLDLISKGDQQGMNRMFRFMDKLQGQFKNSDYDADPRLNILTRTMYYLEGGRPLADEAQQRADGVMNNAGQAQAAANTSVAVGTPPAEVKDNTLIDQLLSRDGSAANNAAISAALRERMKIVKDAPAAHRAAAFLYDMIQKHKASNPPAAAMMMDFYRKMTTDPNAEQGQASAPAPEGTGQPAAGAPAPTTPAQGAPATGAPAGSPAPVPAQNGFAIPPAPNAPQPSQAPNAPRQRTPVSQPQPATQARPAPAPSIFRREPTIGNAAPAAQANTQPRPAPAVAGGRTPVSAPPVSAPPARNAPRNAQRVRRDPPPVARGVPESYVPDMKSVMAAVREVLATTRRSSTLTTPRVVLESVRSSPRMARHLHPALTAIHESQQGKVVAFAKRLSESGVRTSADLVQAYARHFGTLNELAGMGRDSRWSNAASMATNAGAARMRGAPQGAAQANPMPRQQISPDEDPNAGPAFVPPRPDPNAGAALGAQLGNFPPPLSAGASQGAQAAQGQTAPAAAPAEAQTTQDGAAAPTQGDPNAVLPPKYLDKLFKRVAAWLLANGKASVKNKPFMRGLQRGLINGDGQDDSASNGNRASNSSNGGRTGDNTSGYNTTAGEAIDPNSGRWLKNMSSRMQKVYEDGDTAWDRSEFRAVQQVLQDNPGVQQIVDFFRNPQNAKITRTAPGQWLYHEVRRK